MTVDLTASRKHFSIQDVACGGHHRLVLGGELDLAAAPALETCLHQLCADGTTGVVLDLRKLSFMDSTGLRATIVARGLCQEHGCEYRLIQGPPQIRRLFEVSGLLDHLPFAPDEGAVSGGPDSEQTA